jgi:succinyl-CoA reductase
MINDTTRLRWDNLPFGGYRRSGIGREGVRDTMMAMTEVKVLAINLT